MDEATRSMISAAIDGAALAIATLAVGALVLWWYLPL
jgi:hypothetical protein